MKTRFAAVAIAALMTALLPATPAAADHTTATGGVLFQRNFETAKSYFSSTSCNSTSCFVSIGMRKGDFNKFANWCNASMGTVTVTAGNTGETTGTFCPGNGPWVIRFAGALSNSSGPVGHSADVTITIEVHPL